MIEFLLINAVTLKQNKKRKKSLNSEKQKTIASDNWNTKEGGRQKSSETEQKGDFVKVSKGEWR